MPILHLGVIVIASARQQHPLSFMNTVLFKQCFNGVLMVLKWRFNGYVFYTCR